MPPSPLFYVGKLDRWWCFAKTSLVILCLHNWSLLLHVSLLFLSLSLFLYWPLSSKGSNLDFKTTMDILVCWCEYRNWLIEQKGQGLYWRSSTYSLIIVYFWVVVPKSKWHPATYTFFKKVATCNKGKGMCCWFGWHFHDSLTCSYNGVTFSIELLEWELTNFHDLENFPTSK